MQALMVAFNKSIATEFEAKLSRPMRLSHDLTPQQSAFVSAFVSQTSSLLAEAVAGSGKTFTLLYAAKQLPRTTWTCKTMHGLGYSAWANKLGRRLRLDSSKLFKLLKDQKTCNHEIFGDVLKLARVAKTIGIVPKSAPRGKPLVPDDELTWDSLADQYELDVSPKILKEARKLLNSSILLAQKGVIDFDDMLYMPVCFSGVFLRYPLVVVDEAQDLSAIQHEMLRRVLKRDGILVGAGDRNQAIYGFRGALAESIPEMISTFAMDLLPLTVSFRCPRAVVAEAQHDVPHIEPSPFAIEGEILRPESLSLSQIPPFVLCRNTAPIVSLAMDLISSGRGAQVAGREIGKALSRVVEKLSSKFSITLPTLRDKIRVHFAAEIARKPKREASFRDREATLSAIISRTENVSGGSATSATVLAVIDQLFAKDSPGAVKLSTIHRAKGLEFPDILFLDPHLIPSCYANQSWQLQQETNLRYVAVTRAQRTLTYFTSEDIT